MELEIVNIPAQTWKRGAQTNIVVSAGQRLIIETSPGGHEILDETVPTGKQWTVNISLGIDETNV